MEYLTGKIVVGVLVGLAFGYALQRGRFCVNTGFRDVLFVKDGTLLRAWAFAVIIQAVGVTALRSFGYFEAMEIPPFFWAANIFGGFIFGIGMVLGGGCASGTCYRVGEGMLGSFFAFGAFGITTVITDVGALSPVQSLMRSTEVSAGGAPPTIDGLLGVDPWVVLIPVVVLVSIWLFKGRGTSYHSQGWTWPITGIVMGLVGLAAWTTSTATGREFGLSVTGPIRAWFRFLMEGESAFLDWGTFMLLGLFVGSFVAAGFYHERKIRLPRVDRVIQSLIGGVLMGFGAQLAGGCNIGHSFTGLSTLSIGSLATTVSIVLGGWTMVTIMFSRPAWLDSAANSFSRLFSRGAQA